MKLHHISINTTLYFKMLYVALSGLVLIWNFFEETYFCHLHAYLLACSYEKHLKFLTSHIYFHLDNSELWKQYHSASQEMMEQICDLETVESQEIPVEVCVTFYKKCFFSCNHLIYPNYSGTILYKTFRDFFTFYHNFSSH